MLKFWYKQFPQFPSDHADYWRVVLIQHTLLITSVFFLILTLLNSFYFQSNVPALIDVSGFCISLAIYFWFCKSANVKVTSWALTLVISVLLTLFIVSAQGRSYSIFWATIIPPFAIFLVGRNWGTIISVTVFSVSAWVVYQQVEMQQSIVFRQGALFNVIEVSTLHLLLLRFYERTRTAAYRNLADHNVQIQKIAERDKLTGLYNREKLDVQLDDLLSKMTDTEFQLTVIILDIDHFKQINDNFGHLEGDKVLASVAQFLQSQMRNNDLLARWGGEEFVIMLAETDLQAGIELAERLRSSLAATDFENTSLTISLGVAQNRHGDNAKSLMKRADDALYKAKHQGRNCVVSAP